VHEWQPDRIPDQRGRVPVVTGANSGLGLEITRELARRGARVIMAARNQERANQARRQIEADVGDADLEIRELDLASRASVRACGEGIVVDHGRLNVLVNKRGSWHPRTGDRRRLRDAAGREPPWPLRAHQPPPTGAAAGPAARVVSVTSFARLTNRVPSTATVSPSSGTDGRPPSVRPSSLQGGCLSSPAPRRRARPAQRDSQAPTFPPLPLPGRCGASRLQVPPVRLNPPRNEAAGRRSQSDTAVGSMV
jgi:short subunit dehydrogenase